MEINTRHQFHVANFFLAKITPDCASFRMMTGRKTERKLPPKTATAAMRCVPYKQAAGPVATASYHTHSNRDLGERHGPVGHVGVPLLDKK